MKRTPSLEGSHTDRSPGIEKMGMSFSQRKTKTRKRCRWVNSTSSFLAVALVSIASAGTAFGAAEDSSEYNFMVLDPDHPYGSPYGGFSRATASRLSSLPLMLPNVAEKLEDFESFYTNVKDANGRPFLCRAYHEDELEQSSFNEGMFEPPVLRKTISEEGSKEIDVVKAPSDVDQARNPAAMDSVSSEKSPEAAAIKFRQRASKQLSQLKGICAQFHQGWWSYEWCFQEKVSQFHVEIGNAKSSQRGLTIEDLTSLGDYGGRTSTDVTFPLDPEDLAEIKDQDTQEREVDVKVRSFFDLGDVCPETGEPRKTEAILECCPAQKKRLKKNTVFYKGKPMETDIVGFKSVEERETCSYIMTLCTQLLCPPSLVEEEATEQDAGSAIEAATESEFENIEDLSVSEVVDIVFQVNLKRKCIIFGDGGWWAYEFCPGLHVRQFHEISLVDRVTGFSKTAIDTEHFLGRFDHDSTVPKDKEWRNIVNATSSMHTGPSKSRSTAPLAHGGNGAHFYQEYTMGDVCDHEDVTDSAVKAGAIGEGLVERATTIRYGCGPYIGLSVKEDSTCHYVADVTVPALCQHPFFRAPVSKKQVMKCIPDVP